MAFHGFATEFLFGQGKPVAGQATPAEISVELIAATDLVELRATQLLPGLHTITGKAQGRQACELSGFRFDRGQWPLARARQWLDEHGISGEILTATEEIVKMELAKLLKLLGLPEDGTEADCEAKIKEMKGEGEKPEEVAATALVSPDVAKLIGVEPTADLAAVTAAVETLKAKPTAANDLRLLVATTQLDLAADATAEQIAGAIGALGGKAAGNAAADLVDDAIKNKHVIPPARRAEWIAAAEENFGRTQAIIGSMAPILGHALAEPADDGSDEVTPEEEKVGKQLGLSRADIAAHKKARKG